MAIISATSSVAGLVGVEPGFLFINTTDTYATVTTAGYLTDAVHEGLISIHVPTATQPGGTVAFVTTTTGTSVLSVAITGISPNLVYSLVAPANSSSVILPTIVGHVATYANTTGTLTEDPATAIIGNALQVVGNCDVGGALSVVGTILCGTNAGFPAVQGLLQLDDGSGFGGGFITMYASPMGSASQFNITNAAIPASTTITIPYPGGAAANFMLDAGVTTMAAGSRIILDKGASTCVANAVTISKNAGVITTEALTTAGGASQAITLINTLIGASSVLLCQVQGGTNTTQDINIVAVPGIGSATITIYNNTAATALNGTVIIGFAVF